MAQPTNVISRVVDYLQGWRNGQSVLFPANNIPTLNIDPLTGEATIPSPNDTVVAYTLTPKNIPVVFPDEIYTLSAAGGVSVYAGPCQLVGVRGQNVTAGPITITIYDSSASGTGTVLYTGAINTGTEAAITTPVLAFQGVFLSFTGTGTFDITLRGI